MGNKVKLLIISNMAHYLDFQGRLVGWGPAVQEIDYLARLFDEVGHIGCLHSEPAPASALAYQAKNLRFVPLDPTGGETLKDKLGILGHAAEYLRVIEKELPNFDVVHVRAPANIPLFAILGLAIARYPRYRWVKYAGNWSPQDAEAWSYTFQRWLLRQNFHRGVVTVNGRWSNQAHHIYSFFNPCLKEAERDRGEHIAESKKLGLPVQILFVGRTEKAKGAENVLQIAQLLMQQGVDFNLNLIGDSPQRMEYENWAKTHHLQDKIHFCGWLPRPEIEPFYAASHLMLLPSYSEGWPKVLSEAMAYGVVPLAGAVSSIPQILGELGVGRALPPDDIAAYVQAIQGYLAQPERWQAESQRGAAAAHHFTYDAYLQQVRAMMKDAWGLDLPLPVGEDAH
jgi:glycosyltransferase involved in cell wall biosynthesis